MAGESVMWASTILVHLARRASAQKPECHTLHCYSSYMNVYVHHTSNLVTVWDDLHTSGYWCGWHLMHIMRSRADMFTPSTVCSLRENLALHWERFSWSEQTILGIIRLRLWRSSLLPGVKHILSRWLLTYYPCYIVACLYWQVDPDESSSWPSKNAWVDR